MIRTLDAFAVRDGRRCGAWRRRVRGGGGGGGDTLDASSVGRCYGGEDFAARLARVAMAWSLWPSAAHRPPRKNSCSCDPTPPCLARPRPFCGDAPCRSAPTAQSTRAPPPPTTMTVSAARTRAAGFMDIRGCWQQSDPSRERKTSAASQRALREVLASLQSWRRRARPSKKAAAEEVAAAGADAQRRAAVAGGILRGTQRGAVHLLDGDERPPDRLARKIARRMSRPTILRVQSKTANSGAPR